MGEITLLTYVNLTLNVVTLAFIATATFMAVRRIDKADRILKVAERHGELSDAAYSRITNVQPPPAGN